MAKFSYTSSEIVVKEYNTDNFIIKNQSEGNRVALFCSSNGLYYPNDEHTFQKYVVDKKRFEWNNEYYKNKSFGKYIYIRDVFKQWYVKGINNDINSYEKLIKFVSNELEDKSLVTIGSSAGGYVAMLVGCSLNADYILCFSGQFDLHHIVTKHKESNPLYFQEYQRNKEYVNLENIIKKSNSIIFYFVSSKSEEDYNDIEISKKIQNVKSFYFSGDIHGVPIANFALSRIIAMDKQELFDLYEKYKGKTINKYFFELKIAGFYTFLKGYFTIFTKKVFK